MSTSPPSTCWVGLAAEGGDAKKILVANGATADALLEAFESDPRERAG